jgi:archaellum component FlaG (FlaF/FlaG flagellin family)
MNFYITDGKTGQTAEVSNNRLKTESVTQDESKLSTINGTGFNINTGNITLTNATKTAVLYLKNTGDNDIIVDKLFYILGTTTGGAGNLFVEVLRNPSAGTIVSGATSVSINVNRNFGSNNTISALAYKGATGSTFTDGADAIGTIAQVSSTQGSTIQVTAGSIVLKKGASLGINITPPVGNTSMICQFALEVYQKVV